VDLGLETPHQFFGLVENSGDGVVVKVDDDTVYTGSVIIEDPGTIAIRLNETAACS